MDEPMQARPPEWLGEGMEEGWTPSATAMVDQMMARAADRGQTEITKFGIELLELTSRYIAAGRITPDQARTILTGMANEVMSGE
jgi:hypothetical protein